MKKIMFGLFSILIFGSTVFANSELEVKEVKVEPTNIGKQFDSFEFHGYFRTGSDGNLDESFKKVGDKNKNLIGRLGNEYDSFTEFNFSNTFRLDNGAWAKFVIGLDNWNNSLDISSDINLTQAKIEMGKIPGFSGIFKDSVITAGKQGWGNRAVDMTDYFYQDIDAVGLGIDKIKLGTGKLGLAYLTAEFEDKQDSYYRPSLDSFGFIPVSNADTESSDSVRALKITYEINNFTFETMYANAADHDSDKLFGLDPDNSAKEIYSRETANDGIYLGLYFNPKNYYGIKGWGQHYVQFGTGLLGGSGLGRLNTYGNMLAHEDSKAFQIGTGGGTNITEKLSIMTALRFAASDNIDAREHNITNLAAVKKSDHLKEQSELGFSVRPSYAVNPYLDLWLESGIAFVNAKNYNENEIEKTIWKISAGPQLKLNFGVAETAIRAYVTYYNEDLSKKEKSNEAKSVIEDDIVAGFQMSIWF
ncbi:MAG: carbohydrate porin [Fusobacteriaceae bacterium]